MSQGDSKPYKRILRLQRQIHKSIRADVRKTIGPQTRDIRRYYDAYKREFRGPARPSSKEELLARCLKANIILMGDYHTFAQSQKAALRLLTELAAHGAAPALALEMIPSIYQPTLSAYLKGEIEEEEFLEKIDYRRTWGFPWENFRPLLEFARARRLPVIALNHQSEELAVRDRHAAEVLANSTEFNNKQKLFVIYGDLHLARGHIPKHLKTELKRRGLRRNVLTVFQNSESLYWRLAERRQAREIEVLSLARDRYCIINAAPWVKLQSYLEWAEASQLLDSDEAHGLNVHDAAHDRMKHLAQALGLKIPTNVDFTVQTMDDFEFLSSSGLNQTELRAVKYHVYGNRTVFIPGPNLLYVASTTAGLSPNALSEGIALMAYSMLSRTRPIFYDPNEHFFSAVYAGMLSYFGSKVLNPKRKCDLEEDFTLLLKRPLRAKALPQEKNQRLVARLVLSHYKAAQAFTRANANRRYRASLSFGRGLGVFLETTRKLGAIFGEKLYAGYVDGKLPATEIEQLFEARFENAAQARKAYLAIAQRLANISLGHASKTDLF